MQPSATTSHSRERKKERKKRKRRSLFSFEFLRLSVCCYLFSPAGETLPTCIGKEAKVPFLFPPSTGHYNNISPSSVYSNDMSSNETTATVFRLVYYNICLSLYIYIYATCIPHSFHQRIFKEIVMIIIPLCCCFIGRGIENYH